METPTPRSKDTSFHVFFLLSTESIMMESARALPSALFSRSSEPISRTLMTPLLMLTPPSGGAMLPPFSITSMPLRSMPSKESTASPGSVPLWLLPPCPAEGRDSRSIFPLI